MFDTGLHNFAGQQLLVISARDYDDFSGKIPAKRAMIGPAVVISATDEATRTALRNSFIGSGNAKLAGIVNQIDLTKPFITLEYMVQEYMAPEQVLAMLWHEVGHIVNDDLSKGASIILQQEFELRADAYAAENVGKATVHAMLHGCFHWISQYAPNAQEFLCKVYNEPMTVARLKATE